MEEKIERKTMTVPEAAKVLGIGLSVAYEAARTGELRRSNSASVF